VAVLAVLQRRTAEQQESVGARSREAALVLAEAEWATRRARAVVGHRELGAKVAVQQAVRLREALSAEEPAATSRARGAILGRAETSARELALWTHRWRA
jgi:hypothetical protein